MTALLAICTLSTIAMAIVVYRRTRRDPLGGFSEAVDALGHAVDRARRTDLPAPAVVHASVPLPRLVARSSRAS